ncbi:IclR family transcriptional regulator [Thalassospira profundimaris]|jgi:DNA-binding IclR family transcriptional regulator|uniref:IclR family transcriptional regulator n=1 Tax=Thalassospira profundimaris TaxID=502049 RepID=UPI000DEDEA4F|nr:IclR family transcriptional regulator [Thalassospira profundimaris]
MNGKTEEQIDQEKYRAPALSKGLDILELLASEVDGLSQIAIAKQLDRNTSEIFRMLMVLCQRGYIEQREEDDRYQLTTKMFEVAHRHPPIRRLTSIAGDAMQRLANEVNQSMHLAIIHSGHVLVIAQVDCQDNNITAVRLGAQINIFDTASGRVLAAWMEQEALDKLMNEVGKEPSDKYQAFLDDLPNVRAAGYCESQSLTIAGVLNLSAPIFDFSGKVVAALTVPFIQRLSGTSVATVEECRERLIEVTTDISRRLGAGAHWSSQEKPDQT